MESTPLCYEHFIPNCACHMFGAANACGMKELQHNEVKSVEQVREMNGDSRFRGDIGNL